MYELLCHLRVRLGQQPNTGQVAKNKVLGCTSQAYADDLLRQAKINQSKLEKHSCFKGKLTLVLIRESSSQGCKKDKNIITGGVYFWAWDLWGNRKGVSVNLGLPKRPLIRKVKMKVFRFLKYVSENEKDEFRGVYWSPP